MSFLLYLRSALTFLTKLVRIDSPPAYMTAEVTINRITSPNTFWIENKGKNTSEKEDISISTSNAIVTAQKRTNALFLVRSCVYKTTGSTFYMCDTAYK